jgi:hypothetical protein
MTTVPKDFIDELFEFYDEHTLQTDFVINLDHVAKWLNTTKFTLIKTLRSSYKVNIDYTSNKTENPNKIHYRNNNYKLYNKEHYYSTILEIFTKKNNRELPPLLR